MAKVLKKKVLASTTSKPPFHERLKRARKNVGLSQTDLAAAAGCSQQLVQKLEQPGAEGSTFVVQLAIACKVSPYWLALGDGEMVTPTNIPPDALAIGAAWAQIKAESLRNQLAKNLLEVALPFIPPTHPIYKHADKVFRAAKRGEKLAAELAPAES